MQGLLLLEQAGTVARVNQGAELVDAQAVK
jgi:hypothetical protein